MLIQEVKEPLQLASDGKDDWSPGSQDPLLSQVDFK